MKIKVVVFTLLTVVVFQLSAQDRNSESNMFGISPFLSVGMGIPMGTLNEFSSTGAYFEAGAELNNALFKNISFKAALGMGLNPWETGFIDEYSQISLAILAGYSLPLLYNFCITPRLGFGFIDHIAKAEDTSHFLDFTTKLEASLSYNIKNEISIYFIPQFSWFFQQNASAGIFSLCLGASWLIPHEIQEPEIKLQGSLTVDKPVFSPNGDGIKDTITFHPLGDPGYESWSLMVNYGLNDPLFEKSGIGQIPMEIEWDGKSVTGETAPDGSYYATLILFGKNSNQVFRSPDFILLSKEPDIDLTIEPKIISVLPEKEYRQTKITVTSSDFNKIVNWKVEIFDSLGMILREYRLNEANSMVIYWDGKDDDGAPVQPGKTYSIVASIHDIAGNSVSIIDKIEVEITEAVISLDLPGLVFEGFYSDYTKVSPEQLEKTNDILDRLVDIIKDHPGYKIMIEGYATNVYTYSLERMEQENREACIPLSLERAESIKKALIERGIDEEMIITVGMGNANPLVHYTDTKNQWKNRRVEFILVIDDENAFIDEY